LKYWLAILFCALATPLLAQETTADTSVHFRAIEIFVDSGSTPLAAYQLEFTVTNVLTRIVGIEGGQSPVFREPPFYDSKAMQQERVIIAAFSTETPEKLPPGKTRVATVHIETVGAVRPAFQLKLQVAANAEGKRISAKVSCVEKNAQ
jgi:hypothetical protein